MGTCKTPAMQAPTSERQAIVLTEQAIARSTRPASTGSLGEQLQDVHGKVARPAMRMVIALDGNALLRRSDRGSVPATLCGRSQLIGTAPVPGCNNHAVDYTGRID